MAMQQDAIQRSAPPAYEKYNTIDEIPSYCAYIADKLSQQLDVRPDYQVMGSGRVKKLQVESLEEAKLIAALAKRACAILGTKQSWHIYNNHKEVGLHVFPPALRHVPCSLEMLLDTFRSIVEDIKSGWRYAQFKDFARMMGSGEDERYWKLIVKINKEDRDEVRFIEALIPRYCGYSGSYAPDKFKCSSWGDFHGENGYRHVTYMWIRNDVFNEIQARLNLSVE